LKAYVISIFFSAVDSVNMQFNLERPDHSLTARFGEQDWTEFTFRWSQLPQPNCANILILIITVYDDIKYIPFGLLTWKTVDFPSKTRHRSLKSVNWFKFY
jgi:hypothetical protein